MSDSEPRPSPLPSTPSSVAISEFGCSSVFVVGAGEIQLSWACENAARIEILRCDATEDGEPIGEEQPVVGKTHFETGEVSVHVERDTRFCIVAYPPADGDTPVARSLAAERYIYVDQIQPWLFYGLLVSVIVGLLSFWSLSEGLLHGVDIVDNTPLLQLGAISSRMLAVIGSVLGAPLVAALLQIRAGRASTAAGMAFALLRRPLWWLAAIVVSLVPPILVGVVLLKTNQRYVSSEIARPVHIWDCEGGEFSPRAALRLTIPPGLSSVRVRSDFDLLGCVTPEGVVSLNPHSEASGGDDDDGWFAELFEPEHRLTLTCNQRVVLRDADPAYHYRLQWDDDSTSSFDAEGELRVAKKYVGDCASYSRWARFERETPVGGETYERLSWRVPVDRAGKQSTVLDMRTTTVALAPEFGTVYVTLGEGDVWNATRLCNTSDEACELTIPARELASAPRHLCITPRPPLATPTSPETCGQEQSWSYFENLEVGADTGDDTIAKVGSLVVCLPPDRATAAVRVASETASWRGTLDGSRPQVLWPMRDYGEDAAFMLAIGDELIQVPVRDGALLQPEVPTRDGVRVTVTVDRVPQRFSGTCKFEPAPLDGPCDLCSEVVVTGRGQHVVFEHLPEWATSHVTHWRAVPEACKSLPEGREWTCKLLLRGGRKELRCESSSR